MSGVYSLDWYIARTKARLAKAISATEERLEKLRSSMANAKNSIAKDRKSTDMTELTPELLRTFVAKIIVYEKEVQYSKHAPQKLQICFRDFNLNETDDMLACGEITEKAGSAITLPAWPKDTLQATPIRSSGIGRSFLHIEMKVQVHSSTAPREAEVTSLAYRAR
ncbi:MAG: DUF4368 domain-containing protein [Clostridiales bacterium]|uniref:DUF4368 domain-containing protein n=1 Tax=Flavonifractor porci TaxID=3133422 RepID=UPI0030B0F46B|nr:DUF4368 domain-containing protein [Clostridiales bacterium]